MSTEGTLQTVTTSSEKTEALAERLASNLRGREVIELVSDLGGGKTTFVRGLARGLGSKDHVSSPTYTINQIYQGNKLTVNHYDFYRLGEDAGLMRRELEEAMHDDKSVIVLEWGQAVRDVLTDNRLTIHIKNVSENDRELSFACPKSLVYLLENVC